jgi:RHS repeat-associated protein
MASVPSSAIRYVYAPNNALKAVVKPEAEYGFYTWDAAGNLSSVKRISSTKLSIIEVEPTKGAVGETVDIWGTGFSSTAANDTVKFNGTAATVTAASADTLAVKVPSGATTGTVTVQTTTEGPVTSGQTFTVASAPTPTITSLSASDAAAGAVVTVTGTNFETKTSNDDVYVNQTAAEVTSSTSTSLKFVVPEGVSSGRVAITTPHGSATSSYLYIPPAGYTAAQIGPTANMTLGSFSTLTVATAKTIGVATVEATNPEMLSAVLKNVSLSAGTAYLYGPRYEEVSSVGLGTSGEEKLMEPASLPMKGTYSIVVVPNAEFTGKVELAPYYADTVTGTLTPTTEGSAKSVSLSTPGQKAEYTVSGTAGEEVSLKVSEFTGFTRSVELEWQNPAGERIGENVFNGNGFMEAVEFPTTGTYTLIVRTGGTSTGSLKLTAYNATAVTGSITPTSGGESKTITTSVPGQGADITFAGNAGEEVSLVLAESTFKSGSITVLTPEGAEVSEGSRSFNEEEGMVGRYKPFVLPKTATYTIRITAAGEETGHVKLTAYKVTDVTGSLSPTTGGASETVSLPEPGQEAKYTVSGSAGEEVSLKVSEFTGFTRTVELEWQNPANERMTEKGFSGNGFMEPVEFPTTGTYTLIVRPGSLNTGSLKLTAYNATALTGSITPTTGGESKTITTTVPGQDANLTFSGNSGEEISLILSESTFKSASVTVLTSEGREISEGSRSFSEEEVMVGEYRPFVLSKTGTYTIHIVPLGEHGAETGKVKLTAYKVVDVTGSLSPTTSGSSENVSLTEPGQEAKYSVSGSAGEEVSLKVSEFTGFSRSVYLEWRNPEGRRMTEQGFSKNGFMRSVAFPTTGTYTLVVETGVLNVGSLKLTSYSAVTGTITPSSGGESTVVTTHGPGQNAKIAFSGKSGEEVSLVLSESAIEAGWVSIVNSEGSRVGEEKRFTSGAETALGPVSLSATGTYTILIAPENEYTGSVKLTAYIGSPPHGLVLRAPDRSGGGGALPDGQTLGVWPTGGGGQPAASVAAAGTRQTTRLLSDAAHRRASSARVAADGRARAARTRGRARRGRAGLRAAASAPTKVIAERADGSRARQTASGVRPRTGRAATHARAARGGGTGGWGLPRAVRAYVPAGSEAWYPQREGAGMSWTTGRPASPWATLAAPAPVLRGTSALAGQALKLNGLPLEGLHVSLENSSATGVTNARGQFVLAGVPAGHQVLVVEGGHIDGQHYGTFAIGMQIKAHEETTLEAPIWMTPLDAAGNHRVASPTTGPVSITTPRIPGLEVRLPAGTIIHDAQGHVVRDLNITAVPVDRPPFPLPEFIEVPVYFTVQPGRAYLSKGAQIIYPNYTHLRAGSRVAFWNYDPNGRGWYIYGYGSVTANGKQVVPDPDVRVWEFTGAMITGSPTPPTTSTRPGTHTTSGDPVDLGTGLFDYTRTDLVIPDTIPIVIERSYRQGDSNNYSFGVGTTNRYELRLWAESYHEAYLVFPNGGKILYKHIAGPEGYIGSEYKTTNTPTVFYDSTIKWNGSIPGWELTLTDGTTYIFGSLAPLQAIRNKQGQQLTITRAEGQKGNITRITSPHGRWVKFTYNSSNDITEIKDNTGRKLKYKYTAGGLLESATDPAERTMKYEYDGAGDMKSITDPRGNKYIENEYEAHDRVSKQKMANGGTYEFGYTVGGGEKVESTTVTEPRESKRKVVFNSEGWPTSETIGLGSADEEKTTFEPQSATGLLLSSTDPRSRKTAYEYDSYGNVTVVTRLAGTGSAQTYKYTYEPGTAELTKETDPLGHSTKYEYNSLGERTATSEALGHTTHYEYNSDGQLAVVTNPEGHRTTIAYEHGEPASVTDPFGRTSKQFVDTAGRMVATTAPGGQQTINEYNNDNQLTKTTDPAGNVTSYEYDGDGDLTSTTDPLKNKTTFAYTKMDLLESEEDPLEKKATAVYDAEGNLTEYTDRRGKLDKFVYDPLNRLAEAKYGVSGETAESTIKYEYDDGNRLTKVVDSASGTYTPEYDELNRLKSLATPQGTIKYEYDEANRRTSMTVPGQEAVKYTYNEGNLLKEIKRGTQAVSFAYNEANLPTSTTLPDGIEKQYGYDEANELTSITYKKSSTTLGELDYSYDLDGRKEAVWGSYARTALPEAFSSAKYNADNEQTERGSKKLSYDANGNLTSDGTSEYKWNARNQLTSITGTIKASFGYDPFGRRTTRTLSGTTTELLYDGPNVVQEIQSGTATANLLTGLGVNNVFARTTSKTSENLLTDQLGSTIALAGSTGSVETTYTYDPFGTTAHEGTASENTTQYTGQENDGNGLYYDRARYYSPAAARFISQDPLGEAGSGPNLYQYVHNNPTSATDRYGTETEEEQVLSHPGPSPAPAPSPVPAPSPGSGPGPGPTPGPSGCEAHKGQGLSSSGDWSPGAPCSETPVPPEYDPEAWTKGSPSREKEPEDSYYDPEGGEWHWHSPDRWHEEGHWDYKPGEPWNAPWEKILP